MMVPLAGGTYSTPSDLLGGFEIGDKERNLESQGDFQMKPEGWRRCREVGKGLGNLTSHIQVFPN